MLAPRLQARALALEGGPDAALPAFQDARLALPLALKLRWQTWLVRLGEVLTVRRNRWVGTKDSGQRGVRLGVVAIRQTEDPVQEGPMPVTENVQNAFLNLFLCLRPFGKIVSWKL